MRLLMMETAKKITTERMVSNMSTHLIVYGHGAGDPGAVGDGTNERDFNRQTFHPYLKIWADKLKNNKVVFWDITGSKDLYQDTAKGWGIYGMTSSQYASISEFHLDAASATATGGHGIIYKTYSPDNFDLNVVKPIKDFIGWWGSVQNTQGINRRDNLLNCNVAAQRGINYRLIELCFITNPNDMKKLRANLDQMAKTMIESITGEKLDGNTSITKPPVTGGNTSVDGASIPVKTDANRSTAHLDEFRVNGNNLYTRGWHIGNYKYQYLIIIDANTNKEITRRLAKGVNRPDVNAMYKTSGDVGFSENFDLAQFKGRTVYLWARCTNNPKGEGDKSGWSDIDFKQWPISVPK